MNKKIFKTLVLLIIIAAGLVLVWQYFNREEKPEIIQEQGQEQPADKYDQNIVWWDNQALDGLHQCFGGEFECVESVMQSYGAGTEAIEFYKETGWFATEFKEYGIVDMVYILNPWRANSNEDYAMVNGQPLTVIAEEEIGIGNENIGNYELLSETHPGYLIWGADNDFAGKENNRFVFRVDLKDEGGCHACSSGYTALVSLGFDEQGAYQGVKLEKIEKTEN